MSGCLSVCQTNAIFNEFSFIFLSFLSVCLSVCLSNKGHLFISFSSFFFLCLSAPGRGTPILGSTGMCRPKALHFSAWAAPKDSTFSTWTAPKDPPFQKYTFVCSTFPTWAALNDPPFKSIRFFVIFSSKNPSIFSKGPL